MAEMLADRAASTTLFGLGRDGARPTPVVDEASARPDRTAVK
jgi:hypothetical protein